MGKVADLVRGLFRDDDWSDILGDPFIPGWYKAELMREHPEKFGRLPSDISDANPAAKSPEGSGE